MPGDQTQRITLDPDPPLAGQKVTICYDFEGLELSETTLRVSFPGTGGTADYEVSVNNPCVTIDVPGTATRIAVEDLDGPSPDKQAPVV